MSKFLDNNGVLYLWAKIKGAFVQKESGKGLSTNDYTTTEKNKLAGIAAGATANTGTITGIKMNGASKGTSGVVDLGTVLTAHQTIKQDGVTGATVNRFGTCDTAAGTAAKAVSITTGTFSLEAGARVAVKFDNANTASTPTLNVNSKGAKNIFHKGAKITSGSNKALLAGVVDFIYDGTQWHLIGNYIDSNDNTKVTSVANHYTPTEATVTLPPPETSGEAADAPAQGIMYLTGITLKTDAAGHAMELNEYSTTLSSLAEASGGDSVSLVTTGEKYTWNHKSDLKLGTSSSTAAKGNHTHTLGIATDSGTSELTLAHGTKYKITAGGDSFIFTMPSYSAASQSANGLMSKDDKKKLDAFGAASTYALKTDLTGLYKYKGTKATVSALPTSGNTAGDVWDVQADGMNYAWDGSAWDALGATFTIDSITNGEIDEICV